jgi:hypothetical protein
MVPGEDMTTITYFCVADGCDAHGWQATCLNVDIAVEGRTFADVKARLEEAVELYVEEAMKMPPADRDRLLNRSVPFSLKLAYAFRQFWHSLRSKRQDGDMQASFEIPCHA